MNATANVRRDWLRTALLVIPLVYAVLAGFRLVSETDLGWQMATGRYIVQHRAIPSTTLYNYTVPEAPWIYPPLSGVIFYLLFLAGGYAALSWLNAAACAATLALATWQGGKTTAALAILAVPAIALRTMPRADLFTTVLFAAMLALLWRFSLGAAVKLWILPVLMLLWVNLHTGFIAGLAMMGGYVVMETCDALMVAERRAAALDRLRRVWPWMAAAAAATLVNPWGLRIFGALEKQNRVMEQSSRFVGEWSSAHFNALAVKQFWDLRDPGSADWWLMAVAALTIVVCLWKKRIGPAILMSAALYEGIAHLRFQAILAIFVVVIGGTMLPHIAEAWAVRRTASATEAAPGAVPPAQKWLLPQIAVLALFCVLVALRSYDLVSNRHYIDAGETTFFGAGESWWFPEKAMRFIEREKLPRNLFHDYNVGGFVTFRAGESYPDFADGRFIPFAEGPFRAQRTLLAASPDSPEWLDAAAKWNINTIVLSLSRYAGLDGYSLGEYCRSANWKPVYVDDVSIIFVRNRAENAQVLAQFPVSCEKAVLPEPDAAKGHSRRAHAERFNFLLNSGSVYYLLSRDEEASSALQQAEALFPQAPSLHLVRAQLLQANHREEDAEREYTRAVRERPSDAGWFALATLYNGERRYDDAERCLKESIAYSQTPYERVRSLGLLYISMGRQKDALAKFDEAEAMSPFRNDVSSEEGRSFHARLAAARARAYRTMSDLPNAIAQQEHAAQLVPSNAGAWDTLAELAQAQGDAAKAQAARKRAESVRNPKALESNQSAPH
jgi:Tfp pilus assembly protein PilF